MAKYQIPENYKKGFLVIHKLNNSDFQTIYDEIKNAQADSEPVDIVESLEGKVKISSRDLISAVKTIYSLINLSFDSDHNTENLVNDLASSFVDEIEAEPTNSKDVKEDFSKKLSQILNVQGHVRQSIKAFGLLNENEKIYSEGRIISDIRIVFDSDLKVKTKEAVLIHQLKLSYIKNNNEDEDIFISLDGNDLLDLKEVIERAIEKEKLIYNNTFTKELLFIKPKKK